MKTEKCPKCEENTVIVFAGITFFNECVKCVYRFKKVYK